MRKKQQKQMPLIEPASGHPPDRELETISSLIDNTPTICDYVLQDLNKGKAKKAQNRCPGYERRPGAPGGGGDAPLFLHL